MIHYYYFFFQAANSYTYDEIQVGLANCPAGGDPVVWLNDNWQKLIETVQTLATKYGQEHQENIVGTISTREARDALKKHKGNVWQAVTECIERRRLAFNAIKAQGNYSRDDIVTYLTQHQGNVDLTLNELNRLQLKPFLLKIFGSPSGAENQSAATSIEAEAHTNDGSNNGTGTISRTDEEKNSDILRDIEAIIGNMEEKQSKQTETILQTIESLVGNMMMSTTSTQNSQLISSSPSSFSVASYDRIDVKSPVQLPKQQMQQSNVVGHSDAVNVENDVRQFVTSHIQDIVPDIAAIVNRELNESEVKSSANDAHNFDDDDDDDTAEFEDAIIELVLENPSENESPAVELELASPSMVIEPENTNGAESLKTSVIIESENVTEPMPNDETIPKALVTTEENVDATNENLVQENWERNSEELNRTEEPEPIVIKRTPSVKRPKFTVNKAFQRCSLRQGDRRRIRQLERQLRMQRQQQHESDSRMSGYLSDSTVVGDEIVADGAEESQMAEIDAEVETFSFSIAEHENVETEQIDQTLEAHSSPEHINSVTNVDPIDLEVDHRNVAVDEEPSVEMATKDTKNRNLSEIVRDTKELIQKMKNEIDEDIAMSEFDEDHSVLDSDSDYSDEFSEEEQEPIEFNENELDDSDGWTDIDDDGDEMSNEDDLSDENDEGDGDSEGMNHENTARSLRSSQSIESERFVEAQEELVVSGDEPQLQSDIFRDPDLESIGNESPQPVDVPIDLNAPENVDIVASNESESEIVDSIEIPQEGGDANDNSEIVAENMEEDTNEPEPMPLDSIDYLENIIEIQQSLQSSLVSLNVREALIVEKAGAERNEETSIPVDLDSTAAAAEETIETNPTEGTHELIETVDADLSDHPESALSLTRSTSEISEAEGTIAVEPLPTDPDTITSEVNESVVDNRTPISEPSSHEMLVQTYEYNKITVPVITSCSQTNINVMQLKKVDINRNKIPVRRPSFSEPSASIRNLQNELFNKQYKPLLKPVAKKPSKIVPPKLFFKETPSTSKKVSEKNRIAIGEASTSSRAVPKKKYYETCFSDDYQTSDDEKPIGSSKKVIPNLVKIVETRAEDMIIDPDALARRFMDEGLLENYLDAALAVELIQMKFDEKTAIAAAVECNSLEQAITFLRQECELCTETYPMNEIVSMLKCTHSCCVICAKNYFTIQVSYV